ncbi:hypothetical protein Bra1253DRAFT_07762 [Bradyrhizobium sp. WSM1253]|nr:hypothetical protein Bra1253DRAFT_07762 [Bradyrhizobium sp. WSM1253]
MSLKRLLTISLVLPLTAISATAYAGSTISDKSYWPSETRQAARTAVGVPRETSSAFAYDAPLSPLSSAIGSGAAPAWRYQGGPKSH